MENEKGLSGDQGVDMREQEALEEKMERSPEQGNDNEVSGSKYEYDYTNFPSFVESRLEENPDIIASQLIDMIDLRWLPYSIGGGSSGGPSKVYSLGSLLDTSLLGTSNMTSNVKMIRL